MMRQKYATRPFLVRDERVRETLLNVVRNMPLDAVNPLQVIIREEVKGRKLDQQALLFAGPMRDIADQAWINGRQFSVEIWHRYCKQHLLPEEFDQELCKEGYVKWEIDPDDTMVLVGSTTELTVKGYSEYLEKVFAFGANLGVQFRTGPNER